MIFKIKKHNKKIYIEINIEDNTNTINANSIEQLIFLFFKTYIPDTPNKIIQDVISYSSYIANRSFYSTKELGNSINYNQHKKQNEVIAKNIKTNILTCMTGTLKFSPYQIKKVNALFKAIEDFCSV